MNYKNLNNIIDITIKNSKNKNYDKKYHFKLVAKFLGIKYNEKTICMDIYDYLNSKKSLSEPLKYLLSKLPSQSDEKFCKILINILYELFYPSYLGKNTITNEKYIELLKKKKNKTITKTENIVLEYNLYIKFCRCLRKLYIKNIINKEFFNIIDTKYNNHAICYSSIFKKRNIKPVININNNCSKLFNWYRYIKN